jgi:hypothetical protein
LSDEDLNGFALEPDYQEQASRSSTQPQEAGSPLQSQALQQALATFNAARLAPSKPADHWRTQLLDELYFRTAEGEFIEGLRSIVAPRLPVDLGDDPDDFMTWFEGLAETGPGQGHPLFDYLAAHAPLSAMLWFLEQEAAGEAGFDDLLAMTQVKLPVRAKLEFARNYWDEMGHGKIKAMHGEMLGAMVDGLNLKPTIASTVTESLMLGNAMVAFASSRRYAYHAIGALGVIELTAPGRVRRVAEGMKRLGLHPRLRAYFDLHAVLDVKHAQAWNAEVIRPLVEADPACARFIAEGALIRLYCGERCFERYSRHLLPVAHLIAA